LLDFACVSHKRAYYNSGLKICGKGKGWDLNSANEKGKKINEDLAGFFGLPGLAFRPEFSFLVDDFQGINRIIA